MHSRISTVSRPHQHYDDSLPSQSFDDSNSSGYDLQTYRSSTTPSFNGTSSDREPIMRWYNYRDNSSEAAIVPRQRPDTIIPTPVSYRGHRSRGPNPTHQEDTAIDADDNVTEEPSEVTQGEATDGHGGKGCFRRAFRSLFTGCCHCGCTASEETIIEEEEYFHQASRRDNIIAGDAEVRRSYNGWLDGRRPPVRDSVDLRRQCLDRRLQIERHPSRDSGF